MDHTYPRLLLVTLTAIMLSTSSWADESAVYQVDLESQPLSDALKSFADQTGLQIMFFSELTDGVKTATLAGDYTVNAALDILLGSSGLTYEHINERAITVRAVHSVPEDEGGDSDSKNSQPTPVLMAQNQTIAPRKNQNPTDSGSHDTDESDAEVIPLEEIIVTGTNIRGVENPTVPVIQFDREDIEISGALTVEDFVRTIPQNLATTSPFAADSANNFTVPDNATSGSALDLRGLGTGTTLTLLNGRRMTPTGFSSFVDISLLPLNAIDRVDVLTDGASAIYGTDAVGGVVNFITRRDYQGFDVSLQYGTVTDGSREEYSVGASGGLAWPTGALFGGLEYFSQEPLFIGERDFFDQASLDAGQPFGPEADRLSATIGMNQRLTNRISVGVDALYSNRDTSGFNSTFTQSVFENKQEAIFINSRVDFELTDKLTATAFYDFSREDADSFQGITGTSEFSNELNLFEGQISGEFFPLPSGESLSSAVGVSHRNESFQLERGGASLVDVDRDITAFYGEFLVPIVAEKDSFGFVSRIDLSVAGRYEDFSDFGTTFNPKIGISAVLANDLQVRASYSEAFRVPTLQEIELPLNLVINPLPNAFITTFTPPAAEDPALTGSTVLLATSGGNPDLQEETADVWSVGGSYTPSSVSGLTITFAYYAISYEDRLEVIAPLNPLQNPAFVDLAIVNPDSASVSTLFDQAEASGGFVFNFAGFEPEEIQVISRAGLQNIGVREVDGVDANFGYDFETDIGTFFSQLNVAYILNFDSQLAPAAEAVDELDALYRPIDLRMRGSIGWRRDGLTITGVLNYSGSYDDNVDRAIANNIGSWTTIDLNASYQFGPGSSPGLRSDTKLSFNIRNLFDEEPPTILTADGFNYDTVNADPFGRFVSLAITKSF